MIKTRLTEVLNIEYPIIQGGMAWVAESTLAAAVSNAGGIGLIAGGSAPAEVIRREILKARELTDKPFGVNIMLMSENAPDLAQLVEELKVSVVTTGAGSPAKYIDGWKAAGIKVIPVIPTVALALRMERAGADAVIAEGCESGGHIGELTTMALVPQVADAVKIPVIAAGGIADGRGVAASLMLGAQGVQVGTRFLASEECKIHENYKKMVLDARDTDTAVTGRSNGHPARQIRNRMTRHFLEMEKSGAGFEELEALTLGSLRRAALEGDRDLGSFMAGQISGMIKDIRPCGDIIKELFADAEGLMKAFADGGNGGITIE